MKANKKPKKNQIFFNKTKIPLKERERERHKKKKKTLKQGVAEQPPRASLGVVWSPPSAIYEGD
jgi:hypothetical protein